MASDFLIALSEGLSRGIGSAGNFYAQNVISENQRAIENERQGEKDRQLITQFEAGESSRALVDDLTRANIERANASAKASIALGEFRDEQTAQLMFPPESAPVSGRVPRSFEEAITALFDKNPNDPRIGELINLKQSAFKELQQPNLVQEGLTEIRKQTSEFERAEAQHIKDTRLPLMEGEGILQVQQKDEFGKPRFSDPDPFFRAPVDTSNIINNISDFAAARGLSADSVRTALLRSLGMGGSIDAQLSDEDRRRNELIQRLEQ